MRSVARGASAVLKLCLQPPLTSLGEAKAEGCGAVYLVPRALHVLYEHRDVGSCVLRWKYSPRGV